MVTVRWKGKGANSTPYTPSLLLYGGRQATNAVICNGQCSSGTSCDKCKHFVSKCFIPQLNIIDAGIINLLLYLSDKYFYGMPQWTPRTLSCLFLVSKTSMILSGSVIWYADTRISINIISGGSPNPFSKAYRIWSSTPSCWVMQREARYTSTDGEKQSSFASSAGLGQCCSA